jgi:ATP synthase F1 delta subunit
VPKPEKVETLAAAEPDQLFRRFCALLVEKGRAGLLPAVAASYRAVRDRAEGISPLEIEAAREPSDEAVARIAKAWASRSGASSVRTTVRVHPELVAGYRLRSGSIQLDYSIAGRTERLGRQLAREGTGSRPSAPREEG